MARGLKKLKTDAAALTQRGGPGLLTSESWPDEPSCWGCGFSGKPHGSTRMRWLTLRNKDIIRRYLVGHFKFKNMTSITFRSVYCWCLYLHSSSFPVFSWDFFLYYFYTHFSQPASVNLSTKTMWLVSAARLTLLYKYRYAYVKWKRENSNSASTWLSQ